MDKGRVAVVNIKTDGSIWVKRKQYFDPENPDAPRTGGVGELTSRMEAQLGTAMTMPVTPHTEPKSMIESSTATCVTVGGGEL